MKSHNKLHLGGYLSAVLVLLGVGVSTPVTQAYVTWFNEDVKNLDDDTPVLEALTAADYKVSYVYRNEDGDKKTETLGATAKVVDGATAASFNDTLRVLGIDLSLVTLSQTPEYGSSEDHYVLIELPELSKTLFKETVASYCAAFVLERGAGIDIDEDDIAQTYTVQVGSGDAVLFSTSMRSEDDEIGDASSNEAGTCHGEPDPDDTEPEFGAKLDLARIQKFLNAAYVGDDPEHPTPFWIKVLGPRAPANVTEEEGDVFDVALQFYTYPDTKMSYGFTANVQLIAGIILLAGAALMTAFLNVPMEHIRPNIFRPGRPGGES